VKSNGVTVKEYEPVVLDEQICKPEVIKAARGCMEAVVTEGTAKDVFKDFPFTVAGKTGTAHVAGGDIKYYDGVYQASFVGYFPADQPEYTWYCCGQNKTTCRHSLRRAIVCTGIQRNCYKTLCSICEREKGNAFSIVPG
jgi:cell division protein FtsI/penicillin-binding protein 2